MVLAPQDFRDEEYLVPREIWEKKGHLVQTCSTAKIAHGTLGAVVDIDFLITEVQEGDFDGIFLVGGGGSFDLVHDNDLKSLTERFNANKKGIGAICAAPRLLLAWGLLKGIKCTGWNGDNEFEKLAEQGQGIYRKKNAIRDGKFVTGDGPQSAEKTGKLFLKVV